MSLKEAKNLAMSGAFSTNKGQNYLARVYFQSRSIKKISSGSEWTELWRQWETNLCVNITMNNNTAFGLFKIWG